MIHHLLFSMYGTWPTACKTISVYVVGSVLSQGRAGGYIPRVRVEVSSPGGIGSALDQGAKRKQGVEKQIPDILQLIIHRVYDLFPPAGDAQVFPPTPAWCPIF